MHSFLSSFGFVILQFHGFMLYRTIIPFDGGTVMLSCPGIRDRGYVMVNGVSTHSKIKCSL